MANGSLQFIGAGGPGDALARQALMSLFEEAGRREDIERRRLLGQLARRGTQAGGIAQSALAELAGQFERPRQQTALQLALQNIARATQERQLAASRAFQGEQAALQRQFATEASRVQFERTKELLRRERPSLLSQILGTVGKIAGGVALGGIGGALLPGISAGTGALLGGLGGTEQVAQAASLGPLLQLLSGGGGQTGGGGLSSFVPRRQPNPLDFFTQPSFAGGF